MVNGMDSLGLLLVRDDKRPALEGVQSRSAAQGEEVNGIDPKNYLDPSGDLDDLQAQRWGVIVPEGKRGDELLARVRPLIAKRAEDQGAEVAVMRVPNDARCKTVTGAAEWSREFYDDQSGSQADIPLYQLILGDLDEVPLAIQQFQSARHGRVGRLHFDAPDGYDAYVEKLLRWEKAEARKQPARLVVHTAHDNSGALRTGHKGLIEPLIELLENEQDKGRLRVSEVAVGGGDPFMPDPDGFLNDTESSEPGVLFSLSHGLGGPADGWRKEEDRRGRQGAMHFGSRDPVTGADLATRAFMPGGVWFMFACYGAGTPDVSAYKHWLERLAKLGKVKSAGDVLSGLKGPKPFIAALPQRVLANPKGPLAFYGHVDLAWTYSFQDGVDASKRRPGQFHRVVDPVLRADRVGVAVAELTRTMASTETELVGLYDEDARTGAASREAAEDIRRAYLWMERQDLAGYVLLGDPAARLPVSPPAKKKAAKLDAAFAFSATSAPATPAVAAAPTASERAPTPPSAPPAPTTGAKPGIAKLERAILALLLETRTARELSAELGIDRAELERLADAYQRAGRGAIGR